MNRFNSCCLSIIIITCSIIECGCIKTKNNDGEIFVVTILPLKYLADEITGKDFNIEVLVPPGASPETYEPTPQQIVEIERSNAVFTTGLIDFENQLVDNLKSGNKEKIHSLSAGIELLVGNCGHNHDNTGGIDPHIWTSPRELIDMSENMYRTIALLYPDSSKYNINYLQLVDRLRQLDVEIGQRIEQSGVSSFIIYHPAMTYYAHNYGLEQIAIEQDGKEPSATHIRNLIKQAKSLKIKHIIYQSQFSEAIVKTIASDINADAVTIDPLQENIIENLLYITDIITAKRAY